MGRYFTVHLLIDDRSLRSVWYYPILRSHRCGFVTEQRSERFVCGYRRADLELRHSLRDP